MQITLKKLGSARTQVTAVVDDAKKSAIEDAVLKHFSESVEIQGFRKGYAPIEKVREQVSHDQLHEEMVRHIMPEVMKEAIETHKVKPIIRPNVELSSLTPFTLQITLVEKPDVKVAAKKIKMPQVKEEDKKAPEVEESKLLELIAEHTKVDLAPELIDDELRDVLQQHVQRLAQFGMDLDAWLKQKGKTVEDLIKEIRPDTEKRLKVRFGISALIDEWKIDVTDEEMQKAVEELLKPLKDEEKNQLSAMYKPGQHPYEQFRFQKKVEKVMERLRLQS